MRGDFVWAGLDFIEMQKFALSEQPSRKMRLKYQVIPMYLCIYVNIKTLAQDAPHVSGRMCVCMYECVYV